MVRVLNTNWIIGYHAAVNPAVGKPGQREVLPEKLQARESPNDRRKISESIFEGPFKSQ